MSTIHAVIHYSILISEWIIELPVLEGRALRTSRIMLLINGLSATILDRPPSVPTFRTGKLLHPEVIYHHEVVHMY
jgi:hypothetical protein